MDANTVVQGLLARGVPPHIAQGFAGNFAVESRFNPGINEIAPIVPGSRGGFGLAQWTGPRRRQLEAFAQKTGRPLADVDTQLDFLMQELGTTEAKARDAIWAAKTPTEAAKAVSDKFLRPGIPHIDRRLAETQRIAGMPMQQQSVSTSNQSQPEQPKGSRFWNKLGFLKDPDKRAKLAIALEGMTLNPNQALIDMNRAEIEGRAAKGRTNRTAEWLRANGSDDLAGAIEAGGLDGQQAIGLHYQRQQPQGADPTSGMRNYEFLLAQGVDPAEAMERSFGAGGTNVQVTTGNQGPQVGTIPQGYQMAQDPETGAYRMEPIPGGPEDTRQTDANAAESQAAGATNVLGVLEDLRDDIEERPGLTTGFVGAMMRGVPASRAYDAAALTSTIEANLAFDTLIELKSAGGTLGAVSKPELDLLRSEVANLDLNQSPERVLSSIERIEQRYTRLLNKAYRTGDPSAIDAALGGRPSFVTIQTGSEMSDEDLVNLYSGGQ